MTSTKRHAITAGLTFLGGHLLRSAIGSNGNQETTRETGEAVTRILLVPRTDTPPTASSGSGQPPSEPPDGAVGYSGEEPDPEDELRKKIEDALHDPAEYDLGPLHPDLAKQAQLREQEVEATRDFAKSVVAYWHECLEGQMPVQIATTLVREYQQLEMNRLTNIDVHRLRFDNE